MEFMIIQLLSDHQFWYQPITLNLLNDIRFFSNILFLVQLRGFGQSISRLNLIKNWQKCQKTCPIYCSFGFNKSWSEYSLAQGFLSSTSNTFNYSLNEFNSIGWKILHCWININSRFWFDFFPWWNSSKYVSINL